jgi:hypothetical protein
MPRTLTPAMAAEIAARFKSPILLVEIETASTPVRVWTGAGTLSWDSKTWEGTGAFGGVQPAEETADLRASGEIYTLSGVPSALLSAAIGDLRPNLPCRRWLGFVDAAGALIADPILLFEGSAAVPTTDDSGETLTIALSAESLLNTLKRPRETRYTPEDQRTRSAGDEGFDYVAALQDRTIKWGRS